MTDLAAHALYLAAWISFGAGHSLLAGEAGPLRRLAGRHHRVVYNLFATTHLGAVLAIGLLFLDRSGFDLPRAAALAQTTVALLGTVLLVVALRGYQVGRFLGFGEAAVPGATPEPLRTGGLNARVRHPLYLGGLMVLWGLAQSPFGLATACWASLYILIGLRIEERRLLALYGDSYRRYRDRTPALIPRLRQPVDRGS